MVWEKVKEPMLKRRKPGVVKRFKLVPVYGTLDELLDYAVAEAMALTEEMHHWQDVLEANLTHTDRYAQVSEGAMLIAEVLDDLLEAQTALSRLKLKLEPASVETKSTYGTNPRPRWMRFENLQTLIQPLRKSVFRRSNDAGVETSDEVKYRLETLKKSLGKVSQARIYFPKSH
jgi:hypothetical protein